MPKQRHNNQDRVTAPEQDTRLAQIAEACVRSGLPPHLCGILAEGFIARLRRRAWAQLSDAMGDGDDVERLAGWQGPPRVLSKALERAGYLRDEKGILLAADAISEAPEYIKARWRRHSKAGYDAAAARATSPNVLNPRPAEPAEPITEPEEDDMPHDTLFGSMPDVPGENASGNTPHAKFVRRWSERYEQVERRTYPWRAADFKFVQWIITACESYRQAESVIDAYLAEPGAFYRGHELRKLYTDLARFLAAGQPGAGTGKSQARTGSVIARI